MSSKFENQSLSGSGLYIVAFENQYTIQIHSIDFQTMNSLAKLSRRETRTWHITKQVWLKGPIIPCDIYLHHTSAVAINSTTVIFVGANTHFIDTNDGIFAREKTNRGK